MFCSSGQKSQSVAELDFLHIHKSTIVPIEVKSGATGRLRSLHQYMDISKSNLAIRFYNGDVQIDEITSAKGKKYKLMSLPYFLVFQIDKYIDWYEEDESKNNN